MQKEVKSHVVQQMLSRRRVWSKVRRNDTLNARSFGCSEQRALRLEDVGRESAHDEVGTMERCLERLLGCRGNIDDADLGTLLAESVYFQVTVRASRNSHCLSTFRNDEYNSSQIKGTVLTNAPERSKPSAMSLPNRPVAPKTRARGLVRADMLVAVYGLTN